MCTMKFLTCHVKAKIHAYQVLKLMPGETRWLYFCGSNHLYAWKWSKNSVICKRKLDTVKSTSVCFQWTINSRIVALVFEGIFSSYIYVYQITVIYCIRFRTEWSYGIHILSGINIWIWINIVSFAHFTFYHTRKLQVVTLIMKLALPVLYLSGYWLSIWWCIYVSGSWQDQQTGCELFGWGFRGIFQQVKVSEIIPR